MQEHPNRLAACEHVGHELAGQRLGGKERHEDARRLGWLRVCRNTHLTPFAHFLDDAQDAFLGGSRHAVTQLHTLFTQQIIDRLKLGRTVENNRFALVAIEVIKHFPVAQVAGDANHTLTRGQRRLQHFQAFNFANQINRALSGPDPGAGAFGKGFADVLQGLTDQFLACHRIHLRKTLGQVDTHHLARTVRQLPHQPANGRSDSLHRTPRKLGKQSQRPDHQGALELIHRLVPLSASRPLYSSAQQRGVAITIDGVIHDHASGLHEGVADGRPNKSEASLL
ncbi:hypothetical protein D3C81_1028790 [compost metagenome]